MIGFIIGFILGAVLFGWLCRSFIEDRVDAFEISLHNRFTRFEDAIRAGLKGPETRFGITRRPDVPPSAPQLGEATTAAPAGAAEQPPPEAPTG